MDRMTIYFWGAGLTGVLTVITFAYSAILVPIGHWVSEIPGSVSKTTSSWFSPKPTPSVTPIKYEQLNIAPSIAAPVKTPKPIDCDRIVKQIKAGKYSALPTECQQAWQIAEQQDKARQTEQARLAEAHQRELDREKAEREDQARLELERQREANRQAEQVQARLAGQERERMRIEQENQRRQAAQEEADRRAAQQAAAERERVRQREVQKRNDALIKLGGDIRRIFKKN